MFNKPLQKEINQQLKRLKNKLSLMIIIDGQLGQGKTTFAVQLADYIEGKEISFETQLGTGGQDFLQKLPLCNMQKKKVIIYDEAGDFNTRGALTAFNKSLNTFFETFRAFQMVVILVLPFFGSLDSSLYDKGLPRLLIHTYGKSKSWGKFHAYGLVDQLYMRNHLRNPRFIKQFVYRKSREFYQGTFPDLPPKRREELEKFSMKGKQDLLNLYITIPEMAKELNRHYLTVSKIIKKLKVEPHHANGKTKFFRMEVFQTVKNEINNKIE